MNKLSLQIIFAESWAYINDVGTNKIFRLKNIAVVDNFKVLTDKFQNFKKYFFFS